MAKNTTVEELKKAYNDELNEMFESHFEDYAKPGQDIFNPKDMEDILEEKELSSDFFIGALDGLRGIYLELFGEFPDNDAAMLIVLKYAMNFG